MLLQPLRQVGHEGLQEYEQSPPLDAGLDADRACRRETTTDVMRCDVQKPRNNLRLWNTVMHTSRTSLKVKPRLQHVAQGAALALHQMHRLRSTCDLQDIAILLAERREPRARGQPKVQRLRHQPRFPAHDGLRQHLALLMHSWQVAAQATHLDQSMARLGPSSVRTASWHASVSTRRKSSSFCRARTMSGCAAAGNVGGQTSGAPPAWLMMLSAGSAVYAFCRERRRAGSITQPRERS